MWENKSQRHSCWKNDERRTSKFLVQHSLFDILYAQYINPKSEKGNKLSPQEKERLLKDVSYKLVFVHMGGSWEKEQELDIIESGKIHYKKTDIHEVNDSWKLASLSLTRLLTQ